MLLHGTVEGEAGMASDRVGSSEGRSSQDERFWQVHDSGGVGDAAQKYSRAHARDSSWGYLP